MPTNLSCIIQYGIINHEQNKDIRRDSKKRRTFVDYRFSGIPIHSATPETFTIGDGTQGDHDLAPQGHFPWILRDGTRSTDGFHTILYGCISGADLLQEQIYNGLCFEVERCCDSKDRASEIAIAFINKVPHIKYLLSTDVKAILDGDPAAKSPSEIIFCYPAIHAILYQRVAHELLKLGVPVIPRIITEMAHSDTGIDIHPGAQIGEYFSIDHGTGVVIGQTAIIGNHVRLYQGVTLGAKSFTLDEEGLPLDVPRHPIIEDYVTIYSNASILGRITIGHGSVIGGNIWLTHSVPPNSKVLQTRAVEDK